MESGFTSNQPPLAFYRRPPPPLGGWLAIWSVGGQTTCSPADRTMSLATVREAT